MIRFVTKQDVQNIVLPSIGVYNPIKPDAFKLYTPFSETQIFEFFRVSILPLEI